MPLYDLEGHEFDHDAVRSDFLNLDPTSEIAIRHNLSEESVFQEVGGFAQVITENSDYWFNFDTCPARVTRVTKGDTLRRDEEPVELVTIVAWKPYLDMYLAIREDGVLTKRTTSAVRNITFY